MNERDYTWLDDREHTDEDDARASALARRWSVLHDDAEQRYFSRLSDIENGRCNEYEPDYCEVCGGECFLGVEGRWGGCDAACPLNLVGISCPNPTCEDGYEVGPVREAEQRQAAARADRELEREIIEEKLARLGARMMRPYEHWNEDEQYMQDIEEGRFGHASS